VKCTKGLHEMTAENTYRDPSGRVWCRECNRIRIREYKRNRPKKRQDAAFHKTDTFTGRTAMDELLEKDPPVIVWRKKTNGVLVHVSVYDPHPDGGHNATETAVAPSRSLADAKHSEFPIDCENDQLKLLKGDAA